VSHEKKLFEALVREHADMLAAYLRSLVADASEADDLFQETMVIAWRRLDDFDHTRPFGPWLRGIARKLVLAYRRKANQRPCTATTLERLEARLDQIAGRPGDTWEEKLDLLGECVRSLPAHYHVVVVRRYFHEQAIEPLAQTLNLSVAAVKKRLQRARGMVLDCIERKLAPLTSVVE